MNECKEAVAEPALLAFFSLLAVYYNYIPNVALFFFLFPLPPFREKDNLVHMLSIDFG